MNIFIAHKENILKWTSRILDEAKHRNITLRLMGGVAAILHCPNYRNIYDNFARKAADIDFVGYLKEVTELQKMFLELGFKEDINVMRIFGTKRRIFDLQSDGVRCDVVLDKLRFCHEIDLRGRLKTDYPTISLADLILSKLQIIRLNDKDIMDIIALLREHKIGDTDTETINIKYLSDLCSRDWGLWKTITTNLNRVYQKIGSYMKNWRDFRDVQLKIKSILEAVDTHKKSLSWKLRNKLGDRIQWYQEVEELEGT
jgi:hypothetical protein